MNLQEQISSKVLELQQALLSQHPSLPILLQEIWKTLKANPDQVTLLEEGQIGIIVNGLERQTATEIATSAPKAKSAKKITLADL